MAWQSVHPVDKETCKGRNHLNLGWDKVIKDDSKVKKNVCAYFNEENLILKLRAILLSQQLPRMCWSNFPYKGTSPPDPIAILGL